MSIKLSTYYKGCDIPNFSEKDLFHSKDLFLIFEKTPGYRPYLFTVSDDGKCLMHLLAVIQHDRHLFSHSFIRRCVVYGCGVFDDPKIDKEKIFSIVLRHLSKEMSHSAFIIEFRNLKGPLFGYKSFKENGYFPVKWVRVHNSLHGTKTVEQRLSSSRMRQVKKGFKNGASVEPAQEDADIKAFAHMLHHVYSSHIRKYFPDMTFFHHLYSAWGKNGKAKIYIVRYKNKIIGGSLCLYSGENAYLWFFGGMRKTYMAQYPGVLAVWKALKDAQENGYRHFEFMDAGLPFRHHGFREFILRFGGKQSSTRRWFRFKWRWLNSLCSYLYS